MQFPYRHVAVADTAGDSGRQAERDVRRGHVQRPFVSDDDFYQQNFRRQIPTTKKEQRGGDDGACLSSVNSR